MKFAEVSTDEGMFYLGDNGHTIFAITLHPADWRPKDTYFMEVGRAIAAKLQSDRAESPAGTSQALYRAHSTSATGTSPRHSRSLNSAGMASNHAQGMPKAHGFPQTLPVPDFRVGQFVRHSTFGEGEVIEIVPSGQDQIVTVQFKTAGRRRLVASVAGLERA